MNFCAPPSQSKPSTVVAILPVGGGRQENVKEVVACLEAQTKELRYLIYGDGEDSLIDDLAGPHGVQVIDLDKHEPGMEQPRNMGVRYAEKVWPEMTHAWFIDSDILFEEDALEKLLDALSQGEDRILAGPYDWLNPGIRHYVPRGSGGATPDGRWASFDDSPASRVYIDNLGAGLACFGGNLLWPLDEFKRVGGFWNELHMGRCEDGELGLRATYMQVPISLMAEVRGCHLYHDVDGMAATMKNQRDVPMLNSRHAYMPDSLEPIDYLGDREGKRFTNSCPNCSCGIQVTDWWIHAEECGVVPTEYDIG